MRDTSIGCGRTIVALLLATCSAGAQGQPGKTSFEADCAVGKATACFSAGILYEYGRNDKVACDGGIAGGPSCYQGGVSYPPTGQVPRSLPHAAVFYEKACAGGLPHGCLNAGVLFDGGLGVTRDAQRAAKLYDMACTAGLAGGCHNLALMYETGDGVPKDAARAKALFGKGCQGGVGLACDGLRRVAKPITGTPTSPTGR